MTQGPLSNRTFRGLWIGVLASNVGTWMQTVGAQWLVVHEPHAATWVSLVQAVTMLPVLLLALPSGALADELDRRRLLLGVQLGLLVVAGALAALTAADLMSPALLLVFTFALGAGQAVTLPTWQAIIPEVVPRDQLPAASSLGAVNTNLARSAGPAVAGLIVAQAGPAVVFGLNALSFAVFAVALLRWRRPEKGPARAERFGPALRAGARYVEYSPEVRRILLRVALFVLPGSVVWSLLPLVARAGLGLGASGYGVLLAALGVGAIAGALLMPRVRREMSPDRLIVAAGLAYAIALILIGLVRHPVVAVGALVAAGLAWMTLVSRMNAAMQLFLPNWVRARGFAVYQVVFAGGQALGAVVWGQVAGPAGLTTAFLAAAGVMLAGTLTVRWLPLHTREGTDRGPASYWPEPHLMLQPHLDEGPVMVQAVWTVPASASQAFLTAMDSVRRSRRQTGATRWDLFRDGEQPEKYVEVYLVPTWAEHLAQHEGRLTGADEHAEEAAAALATGMPEVTHLLPADSAD
ncbi:MFS transporter [Actinoplanes sp. NBRC 103695]|uniref:MFS transporter n=1 Tax=Actinoplanes sp. NBRC 103695 TaxID=3032202 RepID=UPI0024A0CD70|nr:MFS transporter [Actinoplanes sp. NBRC 103695]GLY96033.1 MFS transporter [Actinoplanes sp. NBRC 103695]